MLTDAEKQKLAAALEQLETERRRREDEKIAAGEAIRVPFAPVVGCPGEDIDAVIERLKAREIEKLRANGETREIYFSDEPIVIVTGVPRPGRDGCYEPPWQAADPYIPPAPPPDAVADTKVTKVPDAPAGPTTSGRVWVQIRQPDAQYTDGVIAEATFEVKDGVLHVRDTQGNSWIQPLAPGADPEIAARRLLLAKHNRFYDPIPLHPGGIV